MATETYKQLAFESEGINDNLPIYPCIDMQWLNYFKKGIETQQPQLVIPNIWGLRKEDLEHFDRSTLEDIFYGTRNLWVPTEMLDLENPSEIAANYLAAGVLKRYNAHKHNPNLPVGSFSMLVKFMNSVAYSSLVFRRNSRLFKTRFPITSRQQETRLADLSGEVKRNFCASFWRDYKASTREEPYDSEAFYDPDSWKSYVNMIHKHFKRRFEREHPGKYQ